MDSKRTHPEPSKDAAEPEDTFNPRRRSSLVGIRWLQKPMRGLKDIRFLPSLTLLFTNHGKLAAKFEVYQFFVVVCEVMPSLLMLYVLHKLEPLVMLAQPNATDMDEIEAMVNSTISNATLITSNTHAKFQ